MGLISMSRYVNEFATNKSSEEIGAIISGFMASEGFGYKDYSDGQKVWQKGDGWVAAPQYIRVLTKPGSIKVEAWIRYAILPGVYAGEMNLQGFFAFAIKSMLKDRVTVLEQRLQA